MGKAKTKTKHKKKDIDEVYEDGKPENVGKYIRSATKLDEEKPGLGQHYCLPCHKYFINNKVLIEHQKTKPHKRQLKRLLVAPHTQADSDLAAGILPAEPVKRQNNVTPNN